jgi:hypothetical protein
MYETKGEKLSCNDLVLLQELITSKGSINLHIKMWVDGWYDMLEPIGYYLDSFIGPVPEWIKNSILNQLRK